MMDVKRWLVFCIFTINVFTSAVWSKELVVATSEFSPWKIVEEGELKGIDGELIKDIASRLGLKIKYSECPFKRCLALMKSGLVDIMTGLLKRSDREVYIQYIEPYYVNKKTSKIFYLLKGNGHLIKKYEDIYRLKVGVKIGVRYFNKFDEDSKIKKNAVTDVIQNLRMLEAGRIDAIVNTESQGDYLIHKYGFQGKFEKAVFRPTPDVPFYFGISKKSDYMKQFDLIQNTLHQIVKEGNVEVLMKKYMGE
ncbi:amino acid ABC transporter substrate-binding protein [Endozoicomonas sp. SM1973]|uniref:Amino acid ABC transporter substrate-binding protein n=1 Tax=Spartinivicinus marinus TaxID=2994442 RepID=A0A853I9L5_9GAMM|nr:transporter substrate-binding domain-containing protein [Spartinivicinus marinus]MCX4026239.1 transporter substrate-binding domain-containing protein [Spartinivicinus marinus]NYZ67348.1 amino acid ABC transporter substrate-binding protein [Spartinivicinus marinus]